MTTIAARINRLQMALIRVLEILPSDAELIQDVKDTHGVATPANIAVVELRLAFHDIPTQRELEVEDGDQCENCGAEMVLKCNDCGSGSP